MDKRATPEQSLEEVKQAEKKAQFGKLKIYLGAAPGVGKTYEMLHDANESRAKNLDVVIGVVESHGREMIEDMIKQFERLPMQTVSYRGNAYTEFDLDAALKRDPGLILIDEMAHTNVEGLRHDKRWQDIKELLDRGIDVYTTLNVQHIESLKDDVTQIIQAPIKETVPDFMIELADTIELVDLPVDDLLKRLHEGKIYIPAQAKQAVLHYFRRGNLIALRELALRTTAACVETEVLLYRKSEGIKKIWPTREKILVCVGANPESLKLIRTAKRMVSSLQAEWIAVYVDVPRIHAATNERNNAIQHLRLAQQLGAETHVLIGTDIVKEIMQFARENNVTQIMVWKYESRNWRHIFKAYIADKILAHCGEINVFIITGPETTRKRKTISFSLSWQKYGLTALIVALATGLNFLLAPYLESSVLLLIYLLGIVLVALLGSVSASLLACLVSVLLFDLIFLNNNLFDKEKLSTLAIMFGATLGISYLSLIKYRQDRLAKQIHGQTRALFTFSRQLLSTRGVDQLIALGITYIADMFNAEATIFMPSKNQLMIREQAHFKEIKDLKEQSVAQWVFDMKQPAGYGTDTLSSSDALYIPLIASSESIGVLKIRPKSQVFYTPEQMHLLEACTNQLTLALQIDRLQEKSRQKELKTEVDSAKNTLLKTLSSHLNFPLNAILSAVSVSNEKTIQIERSKIKGELGQISLINNNILQMIRLESNTIELNHKRVAIEPIVNLSIELLKKRCDNKRVNLHLPASHIPDVIGDGRLLQGVFDNLLDNAYKYSPPDTSIDLYIQVEVKHLWFSVENESAGIDKEDIMQLFKKFYRGKHLAPEQGLGLGLTICKRIIEAHEGRIWVENIESKGVVAFRFILPLKLD